MNTSGFNELEPGADALGWAGVTCHQEQEKDTWCPWESAEGSLQPLGYGLPSPGQGWHLLLHDIAVLFEP